MIKWIKKIINSYREARINDPVYNCEVYKELGCSHVDGYLCSMKDCDILKEYKLKQLGDTLTIYKMPRSSYTQQYPLTPEECFKKLGCPKCESTNVSIYSTGIRCCIDCSHEWRDEDLKKQKI